MKMTISDTQKCPHCGTPNDSGNAFCENCNTPLTAYGGQIDGSYHSDQGRLAQQVALLGGHPPVVVAVVIFDILFALFWPVAFVIHQYTGAGQVNASGSNYIFAALSMVGPVLFTFTLIPIALACLYLAWATWTQRPWAWLINTGVLAAATVVFVMNYPAMKAIVFLILVAGIALFWFRPATKSWFGQF